MLGSVRLLFYAVSATKAIKIFSPALLFLRLKQGSLHVYYHVYVVIVAETLAEAARILTYFSCDVSDFFLQYSVKLL